jgi:hypothetical protein
MRVNVHGLGTRRRAHPRRCGGCSAGCGGATTAPAMAAHNERSPIAVAVSGRTSCDSACGSPFGFDGSLQFGLNSNESDRPVARLFPVNNTVDWNVSLIYLLVRQLLPMICRSRQTRKDNARDLRK